MGNKVQHIEWDFKACDDEIVKLLNYAMDALNAPFLFEFDDSVERGDSIAIRLRPIDLN